MTFIIIIIVINITTTTTTTTTIIIIISLLKNTFARPQYRGTRFTDFHRVFQMFFFAT